MDSKRIIIGSGAPMRNDWLQEAFDREQEIINGQGQYKGFSLDELIQESEPIVLKENRASRRRQKFGKKRK